ncbi:alpha/beta hydrolase [Paenibacillus paeoniae]|uniref:Alpha/beta hydrolase n=1 Tax=Paenibacillus paeoniae TaxID=2292705 RepID=A0A371PNF2_9BACL|nr:alpha/beta hydrolase [Paenibacillus paeoniae]REK77740.1 alpha/beta hydrolase [Paenibacillus paeoniae]
MKLSEVIKRKDPTTDKKPTPLMKKMLILLLKAIAVLAILVVVFLAIVFIVDKVATKSEQGKIQSYGQLVPVDGKRMNAVIQGTGEETIVLLPGFGTAAPALDFKPLIEELSPFYKVVVIEPFGYGLSDTTDKERTTENIVSEIHEALQSLQIDRYILMVHSISGLYGLDYVNKYENEVSAFAGLDSSVPTISEQKVESSTLDALSLLKKLGFARLYVKLGDDPYAELPYEDETKEQMRMLGLKNMYNPSQLNEIEHMYSNFKAAEALTFPKNLPVVFFIQAHHPATDRWVPEHEAQIKKSVYGKIFTFEAGHYLYRTEAKEIAEKFRAFMGEIQ